MMELNHHLAKTVGPTFAFPNRYRWLIGKLIYLTLTHLELAYVHTLAQFMQAPTPLGRCPSSGSLS